MRITTVQTHQAIGRISILSPHSSPTVVTDAPQDVLDDSVSSAPTCLAKDEPQRAYTRAVPINRNWTPTGCATGHFSLALRFLTLKTAGGRSSDSSELVRGGRRSEVIVPGIYLRDVWFNVFVNC
jgi:hypothetical protein